MTVLGPGDRFPDLEIRRVGGGVIRLPADLEGSFGVVLVNRGAWCPYCNAQLRSFRRAQETLDGLGVRTVSFSVDDRVTATELRDKAQLDFPVGYGVDAYEISDALGAFVNPDPVFLQSTGFVLDPDGRVIVSVYSSGAIGRLVPDDVAGLVRYINDQAA